MNWKEIFLKTESKKKKQPRPITGIAEVDGKDYYFDYVVFSGLKWWTFVRLNENSTLDKDSLKSLPKDGFYNSDTNNFTSLQNAPEVVKSLYKETTKLKN